MKKGFPNFTHFNYNYSVIFNILFYSRGTVDKNRLMGCALIEFFGTLDNINIKRLKRMLHKFFSKHFIRGMLVFFSVLFIVGFLVWNQNRRTLQTSSNPIFGAGVPKHLQCPHRLIGKICQRNLQRGYT